MKYIVLNETIKEAFCYACSQQRHNDCRKQCFDKG